MIACGKLFKAWDGSLRRRWHWDSWFGCLRRRHLIGQCRPAIFGRRPAIVRHALRNASCLRNEGEGGQPLQLRSGRPVAAYNDVNVLVHVLSAMVSTLCGCVHVQQVSHCALHQVPQACVFPYTVYSKAFAGSVQLWEAVKASTSRCSVHSVHPST